MASSSGTSSSNHVYIKSDEHGWIPARLLESSHDKATVSVGVYQSQQDMITEAGAASAKKTLVTIDLKDYQPSRTLPLQNVDEDGKLKAVADLVDLDFLHEAAILYNLKVRHKHSKPYTRTGELIIAVNPFQWFHHLYAEEQRIAYANALVWDTDRHTSAAAAAGEIASSIEPHVYETSCQAYRGLAMGENQSILVSGESGAGKTETVKILLSDIASVQARTSSASELHKSDIVQRVLDSNPLLEAFGNAKTVRNDNSSRFGKFIQLQFEVEDARQAAYRGRSLPSCQMVGSECEVYLLEKIRVVNHEPDERTYHIFYQLLASPDKATFWRGLEGATTESFSYVGHSDTNTIEGLSDQVRFQHTIDSLALVGIVDDQLVMLMQSLCIVLMLGNVTFENVGDDASAITSKDVLQSLAELLGVDEDILGASLTIRSVSARNEVFKVPLKDTAAKDSCDAFAKEIYAQAFHWLVRKINNATSAAHSNGNIGLLDIFGFESFVTNRFEQLCINYANEKLQQKFTHDIFRSVQAEYEAEGIELDEITFEDNAPILELIEGRMGMIALLKEECVRPGGSDKDFVSKTSAMHKEKDFFIREKSYSACQFGIHHYAGRVIYDATQFVTRNMDTLPLDLQNCAKKSKNSIVANELARTGGPLKTGTPTKRPGGANNMKQKDGNSLVGETVSSKFRNQLGSLMANLSTTRTRYIRCIKPNQEKKPFLMDHVSTVEQLRCAGVVAAVTISRSAFPNRLDHQGVLDRFRSLLRHVSDEADVKETVDKFLTKSLVPLETTKKGVRVKGFVMGNTRAYFRSGSLEYLEKERIKALSVRATEIQRVARKYLAYGWFKRWKRSAILIQSAIRMSLVQSSYKTKRSAAIRLQCWSRGFAAKRLIVVLRRNYRAVRIQSYWRRIKVLARFLAWRSAAVKIQKIARGALQRPRFRAALVERREEAKLENQVLALQRKLEEAEKRRVEAEKKAEASVVAATNVAAFKAHAQDEKKEVDSPSSSLTGQDDTGMSQQQHTLMDESGKMLEYLRKEVFKLRSHNARLRRDYDLLKGNNQRLMDANASAGASFAALNQHAKQLQKTKDKIEVEYEVSKAQVQKLSITQVELREELKMKQATYIAEVHSRLQYQRALSRIIDVAQAKGGDSRLVDEILRIADACEAEYMNGPTGMAPPQLMLFGTPNSTGPRPSVHHDSGIMSSIRKIWS